ncbi:ArsR/SmtB family transcription factor [Streptomyces koyangensis]|uniref:ArsR/SmtB family transcription factor n=1 Tax=Streptomyces koyangensis TaxID=188770 RepID=UPI001CECEBD8|nr:winged helix-turn-helix domain-containing protein [Streptomyces koyangensis]
MLPVRATDRRARAEHQDRQPRHPGPRHHEVRREELVLLVVSGLGHPYAMALDQRTPEAAPVPLRGRALTSALARLMAGQGLGFAAAGGGGRVPGTAAARWPGAAAPAERLRPAPAHRGRRSAVAAHPDPPGARRGRAVARRRTGRAPRARLLGRTRALLLAALDEPATTSRPARAHGLSPATVSAHLTALRESGLVTRRRVGRAVAYARTPLGLALLHGGETPGTDAPPPR